MPDALVTLIRRRLAERNARSQAFFPREAPRLAAICRAMAERFLRGGRLLAFGRGPYATDAQHVSVEFVHPVIVGKRALPALDLSLAFPEWSHAIARSDDIAMGFGPPAGDAAVRECLAHLARRGVLTLALPGSEGTADYAVQTPTDDPFVHQELLEVLYHTLWETVHVFFEHRQLTGHEIGEMATLYPFLGGEPVDWRSVEPEVARSIVAKAEEDEQLRDALAREQAETIAAAAEAIARRIERGGKLICFGNGGSATDANDLTLDCVVPPSGYRPIPAVSLAFEPANLSAIANDVGQEVMFLRQLIPLAQTADVAIGISTSGSSRNVIVALEEARTRGLLTVGLLGYDGGEIVRRRLVDYAIVVHCDYIPRIQEAQASAYHVLREALEVLLHGAA
ncbi:MAG: SIS domain-containing protein [Thermomicrobium sp.]|nr:SIS domain-containing protein [Thermomicrobium sp.]